jgi:hypothetical protein
VKLTVKFALLAAIPAEAVNFWFAGFPIDVGLPPDASVRVKLVAYQWLFLHYPVILSINWFEKLPQKIEGLLVDLSLVVCGYAETVLLFLMALLVFKSLRQLAGKSTAKAS